MGGEYRLNPFLSLRAGYWAEDASKVFTSNTREIISAGAGFNFGASNLDVAFQIRNAADAQAIFSNGLNDSIVLNRDDVNLVFTYRVKL